MQHRDILVSIAAYSDEKLSETVRLIMKNCSDPKRLDIIIINQAEAPENLPYENVLEMFVDYQKARGVSWARGQIMSHMNKHHVYFLQIDAHAEFYPDWDLTMINNLDDEMDVISTFPYPHDYIPVKKEGREYRPISTNRYTGMTADKALSFGGGPVPDVHSLRPSSISAAMIFAHIQFLKDVGIDSRMNWNHEQSDLTVRAFLKGYNIKSIEHPPVTHIYGKCHARQLRTDKNVITELPVYEDDVRTLDQLQVVYGFDYETGDKKTMISVLERTEFSELFKQNHLELYGFTAHRMLDIVDKIDFNKYADDQLLEVIVGTSVHTKWHKNFCLDDESMLLDVNTGVRIAKAKVFKDTVSNNNLIELSLDHLNDINTSSS